MSEGLSTDRLAIVWLPDAKSDVRAIDRETALAILHCIDRYLTTRVGDVKRLKDPFQGYRLRCGEYRIFFDQLSRGIAVTRVAHRREAYR